MRYDLFERLNKLREASWKDWENKAYYDWRVTFSIWGGLIFIASLLGTSELTKGVGFIGFVIVLFLSFFIINLHFYFIRFIDKSLYIHRKRELHWKYQMEQLIPLYYRLNDNLKLKKTTDGNNVDIKKNKEARVVQKGITLVLFFIVNIISFFNAFSQQIQKVEKVEKVEKVVQVATETQTTNYFLPIIAIIGVLIVVLSVLNIREKKSKIIGAVIGSLISVGSLVTFQFGDINVPEIAIPIDNRSSSFDTLYIVSEHPDIRLVQFADIGPFDEGKHIIDGIDTMSNWINCLEKLRKSLYENEIISINVAGNADIKQLSKQTMEIYGSNFGLASARSNWIKEKLIQSIGNDISSLLNTVTAGPQYVGPIVDNLRSKDRSVKIIVFLNSKNASQMLLTKQ